MFDHNQMRELQHIAADRYQRAGCGGAFKVTTAKAFHDARCRNLSPFRLAAYQAATMFRQACEIARADFRAAGNDFDLALCARRDATAVALATIPF